VNDLCQFPTPFWVADALVERHFPDLDMGDVVFEPTCGYGSFLQAIPSFTPAYGFDIDPLMVERATKITGRTIIEGDFLTMPIDISPTVIIGNPPFRGEFIDRMLRRCHQLLPDGGRAGFILPAYAFRTASRVMEYLDFWSMKQELLPRSAFCSRMREPLVFATFSKDRRRIMVGFALFAEESDRQQMDRAYRKLLANQTGPKWQQFVELALVRLGGEATLSRIYAELENNRPSKTKYWREKVRQTLRVYRRTFVPVKDGHYRLAATT
jgi:hypothetical protein